MRALWFLVLLEFKRTNLFFIILAVLLVGTVGLSLQFASAPTIEDVPALKHAPLDQVMSDPTLDKESGKTFFLHVLISFISGLLALGLFFIMAIKTSGEGDLGFYQTLRLAPIPTFFQILCKLIYLVSIGAAYFGLLFFLSWRFLVGVGIPSEQYTGSLIFIFFYFLFVLFVPLILTGVNIAVFLMAYVKKGAKRLALLLSLLGYVILYIRVLPVLNELIEYKVFPPFQIQPFAFGMIPFLQTSIRMPYESIFLWSIWSLIMFVITVRIWREIEL